MKDFTGNARHRLDNLRWFPNMNPAMKDAIGKGLAVAAMVLFALACYSAVTREVAATIRNSGRLLSPLGGPAEISARAADVGAFIIFALTAVLSGYWILDLREDRPRIYGLLAGSAGAITAGILGIKLRAEVSAESLMALVGAIFFLADGIAAFRRST